jgi:hypothetical protein
MTNPALKTRSIDQAAPASRFKGQRTVNSHTQTIHASPDRIFPLICPVREAEWADGWAGAPVFAASGFAEENGVYATEHAGDKDPTIWFITRRDPVAHATEFVYFVPGRQVVRLSIDIRPIAADRSSVSITYIRTGISDAGNAMVLEAQRTRAFEKMMREWEDAMNHYLKTGQLLEASH